MDSVTSLKNFMLDLQGVLLLFVGTEHGIGTHSSQRIQGLLPAQGNLTTRSSPVQQEFKARTTCIEHLHLLHHKTVGNRF